MPKSTTFLGNFCRGFKFYHFSSEIILGNFYKHLAIFIWSHWSPYAFKALEVDWSFLCTSFLAIVCRNSLLEQRLLFFNMSQPNLFLIFWKDLKLPLTVLGDLLATLWCHLGYYFVGVPLQTLSFNLVPIKMYLKVSSSAKANDSMQLGPNSINIFSPV